jgi:chromosome segregation ATPase
MPQDEAQEYLGKLQAGKVSLAPGAGELEREAFETMQDCSRRVRELTTQVGDTDKQIEAFKAQREALQARINETAGEMGGYAKLLVSAEGARRRAAEAAAKVEAAAKAEAEAEAEVNDEAKGNDAEELTKPPAPPAALAEAKAALAEAAAKAETTKAAGGVKVEELDAHKKKMQAPPAPPPAKARKA